MHNELILDNKYNIPYVSSFNEIKNNEIESNVPQQIMKLEELYKQIIDELTNLKTVLYNNKDKILKINGVLKKRIYYYQIIGMFIFILFMSNIKITFIENTKLNKQPNTQLIHESSLYYNITNLENNYKQLNKNILQPLYISSLHNKITNIENRYEQLEEKFINCRSILYDDKDNFFRLLLETSIIKYKKLIYDYEDKLQQLHYYIIYTNTEINKKIYKYENIQNNITNKLHELQNKFKLHELQNNIKLNNYKNDLQHQIIYYNIHFNNLINDYKNKHSSI